MSEVKKQKVVKPKKIKEEKPKNPVGRPRKYFNETERKEGLKKSYMRPERIQYCADYLKEWRKNNKDKINELSKKYREERKVKKVLLNKEEELVKILNLAKDKEKLLIELNLVRQQLQNNSLKRKV